LHSPTSLAVTLPDWHTYLPASRPFANITNVCPAPTRLVACQQRPISHSYILAVKKFAKCGCTSKTMHITNILLTFVSRTSFPAHRFAYIVVLRHGLELTCQVWQLFQVQVVQVAPLVCLLPCVVLQCRSRVYCCNAHLQFLTVANVKAPSSCNS
jgi:hypothetical protein